MSSPKTANNWQNTKATIRRYYPLFDRIFRSIEDARLGDKYGFPFPHQWSTGNIKSFIRATKLCQKCSGIFITDTASQESPISGYYSHHDSYNSLLRCADSGCRVCVRIVERAQMWLSANGNSDRHNNQLCILWRYKFNTSHRFEFLIGAATCASGSELQSLWTIDEVYCKTELLQIY